jgi:hypothetical protein
VSCQVEEVPHAPGLWRCRTHFRVLDQSGRCPQTRETVVPAWAMKVVKKITTAAA